MKLQKEAEGTTRVRDWRYVAFIAAVVAMVVGAAPMAHAHPSENRAAPAVPPNSVCREYDGYGGGLAPEDHRIGVTFSKSGGAYVTTFSGLPLNFLYATTASGREFTLASVSNHTINSGGVSLDYLRACAPNPDPGPLPPANSVCREYDALGDGLAPEDHRIMIDYFARNGSYVFRFSGLSLSYLYAVTPWGQRFDLGDVHSAELDVGGGGVTYLRGCAVDPGPAMPPFVSRYALIDQQYRDFYNRTATTSEQYLWAGSTYTQSQLIDWFVNGDAAKRGPLVRLYKAYYKRWPDPGGYDYWIRKMKSGTTLTKVSDTFAAANEFKTKYGKLSNSAFVKLVYQNVLEREPDPSGLAFWIRRLDTRKTSRGGLMLQFSESSEYQRKFGPACDLVGVSLRMLRRAPSTTELTDWSTETPNQLAGYILTLPEYAERIQAG
ncbi:MAG: DUF4214 domain-containing protein [Acidimicrobiales bacterium]|nr:DUF4214 domain-containing protein [Acidimicrobiales bacterium]